MREAKRLGAGPAAERFDTPGVLIGLWFAVLVGPLIWAAHFMASYVLVPYACAADSDLSLHLSTLVALAFCGAGAFAGWRFWRKADGGLETWEGGAVGRTRWMGLSGLMLSGLFAMVILAEGVPGVVLTACH